ncbi:organic cation/carnitine transporter 7-like protein [Perkinsela sp. CCAP 1560/4]|nr:synaptic vesicle 2-like protein [Perkinsela sp. CCAP 1560/4]KNH06455.1 organic cation/carnitine transporter 7-like protein [Perkinsela sp. CCAP 1560/4]|eukprot:KNH03996.1 synaptic vesicle 2-like protein [Perkinsela sp. CCAP 1560/4]
MEHPLKLDPPPVLHVEEVVERIGFGRFQIQLLFMIGLPLFADCMEIFLIAFIALDVQREFQCSDLVLSFLTCIVFVGMFFGSIFFGMLSDYIGREVTFTTAITLTTVGGLLNAHSTNAPSFILTRGLCGLGIGGSHVGITLFLEFLPTQSRSLYLSIIQFCGALGAVLECCLAWALQNHSWRWLVRCTAIPAAISALCTLFLPQSPRYLLVRNRPTDAAKVYQQVAKQNGKEDTLPTDFEISSVIKDGEQFSLAHRLRGLHEDPQMRRLTWALCAVWFTVSFSYYGLVFLSATIRTSSRDELHWTLLLISLAEFPAYYLAHRIAGSKGRRNGMTAVALFGMLPMAVLGLQDYFPSAVLLPTMFFARCAFATLFALVVLYTPEAFPTAMRSTACGLTNAFSRIAGAVTPFVSFRLRAVSVMAAGGVYVGVLCMGMVATQMLPFETNGRALRDVVGGSSR